MFNFPVTQLVNAKKAAGDGWKSHRSLAVVNGRFYSSLAKLNYGA